ncbi:hypothetical protein KIN_17040 [Litoreibacter roseus]|uniref:Uncharacterized protein n=1 Tax=Litoreibacter roseus TaxID=2601869 RepID=A0A6N6JFR3_9RHOB|nr:hypothetical protein KIN_17040 [Litoreibacter roseus]
MSIETYTIKVDTQADNRFPIRRKNKALRDSAWWDLARAAVCQLNWTLVRDTELYKMDLKLHSFLERQRGVPTGRISGMDRFSYRLTT